MEEIVGTFVGRWYVTAYGTVFLVLALRHLGLKCTAIYAVFAVVVGALAENGSVHLGIPYTRYAFNPELRGHELWVGEVPLMVPLSYTFIGVFRFRGHSTHCRGALLVPLSTIRPRVCAGGGARDLGAVDHRSRQPLANISR